MSDNQNDAMEWVVNNCCEDGKKDHLDHIHYTGDWIYISDGYQIYRLPNHTGIITEGYDDYPVEMLDRFLETNEDWIPVEFTVKPLGTTSFGLTVSRIGNSFYNTVFLQKAVEILGQGISAEVHKTLADRGLHLYNTKTGGEGLIFPTRLYFPGELN